MVDTTSEPRWTVAANTDLGVVFEETFEPVYRYAARLAGADRELAEDLVQDAYARLLSAVRRGGLTEVGVGWVVVAVRNRFIDHVRHVRHEAVANLDSRPTGDRDSAGAATTAVDSLSPLERLVLMLHHVDGYSVREVAAMIGK